VTVGLLHPGAMGAAVGGQAVAAGARVYWLPEGRSEESRRRAERAGLTGAATDDVLRECDVVLSVCPPANAEEVAGRVAAAGFAGVYVGANAISPERSERIGRLLPTTVDGGIVGGPPSRPGTTRLYLSGPEAAVGHVIRLFRGTMLETVALAGPVGRASAVKLAFASYNKATYVLAAQSHALAGAYGVGAQFAELAATALPGTPLAEPDRLPGAAAKAWRWEPEFGEMAAALVAAGLRPELIEAAARTLARWRRHKDDDTAPVVELLRDLSR
jgi:3-hydroxyisobutyrate dehydrogenase-like beta-hydroxyacid dehydrogenase